MPGLGLKSAQAANFTPYEGPFFITIQTDGGWDVTSFCDPKDNTTINHWADTGSVQTIANSPIEYAPFAKNAELFPAHHDKMLIVNGIDTQTNAHQAGVRHSWSGRFAEGYPAFTALAAAIYGEGLPLAFLSNGGYRETAGLLPYTLMSNPSALSNLIDPNAHRDWGAENFHATAQYDIINNFRAQRITRQQQQAQILPRTTGALTNLESALAAGDQLTRLETHIPETLVDPTSMGDEWNPLLRQAQLALASCKAGLTVSADLLCYGFDTHANHDPLHIESLNVLINGVNYLWAEAERLNIADQLIVFITSDFGRTPEYNDGDGKDHWPITSAIFMQQGATWANQVVGLTDNGHNAYGLNSGLTPVAVGEGINIQPKHVQQALRSLAGISDHPICQSFDLDAEDLNLAAMFG